MPEIKSNLVNKQIKSEQMKDLSISDESGYAQPPPQHRHFDQQTPQFDPQAMREFEAGMQSPRPIVPMNDLTDEEMRIIELKKAKKNGKERLSEGANRRIKMLIEMTRLSKDIDIDGRLYKIQALSSKELRDAITATSEFDGTVEFIFEHRKQLLARSLVVIAGVDITQFLNSYELQDRLDFIELMDHALLLRLYTEYSLLTQEAQAKYTLKTEAEVKEVLEDLKK